MSDPWYKSAILYAIDVEKFADGNGDGIGDFVGLTQRLDYLTWLGVTCIWLLPFYPSPRQDNGYDVTDYFQVDPRFGTLADFAEFVKRAGERGIRVVIDLVLDHTSDQHPWFQAARRSRGSRYRDYYIWADLPPAGWPEEHGPVFPGEEDRLWTYDELAGAYYYHRFYSFQPNLDVSNEEVLRQVHRVIDFWLCFGVSGFRLDAVPIMLGLGRPHTHAPADPHGILADVRRLVEGRRPGAALLGEADVPPEEVVKYFGDDDELDMLFNFLLNNWLWLALAEESKGPIVRVLDQLPSPPSSGQWVNFLRNLDELNLGWLDACDRHLVLDRFSPEPETQLYGRGSRRRLSPLLSGDRARLELAFSLLLTLPGTPMFVYGDEIGLGDDLAASGRNASRVLMQWSRGRNGGFSTASSRDLVRAALPDGPRGYRALNVEAQRVDPDSLVNRVRDLVHKRRQAPEFGLGAWHLLSTGVGAVLAHRCNWKEGVVVAVHNLSSKRQHCSLDLRDQEGRRLLALDGAHDRQLEEGWFDVDLPPFGYQWYRVVGERLGKEFRGTNY